MDNLLTVLLLVAAASGGNIIKENEKLKFDVTASRSIEEPPTIDVRFANGVKDALALKHYRMNEESVVACNYLGHLRNSPSSSVAVTGCLNKPGDRMEVTIISENNINKMFSVDFNGNAEIINNPFEEGALSRALPVDRNFDDQQGDEILDDAEEEFVATAPLISIPSKLKATIKFGYENGLNEELGSEDFNEWIANVFTHTQAHFRHAESLGTTIEFEVQGSAIYNEGATWTADDNIYDARAATNAANLNGVDTMSWWCSAGGGGVAGIAFVGALCSSYNTNLNEKQRSAAGSGFVLAHELGHNFGMSHDFDDKHGGHSGPCNGQGIMSYGSYDYNQWSTCSRSDWEEHYSAQNWKNCLEDISGGECKDLKKPSTCKRMKRKGKCRKSPIWAKKNCQKTCGLCVDEEPDVCTDVTIVTKDYGEENRWIFGSCRSTQEYTPHETYTEECCQPEGTHNLVCIDTYGDGWHGGYIEIGGMKYCGNFTTGFEENHDATMPGSTEGSTESPTQAPPSTECGINPGAIVGGSEVTPYSLPWQVGLVSPGSIFINCGGILIGPQHVLTAAHCMGRDYEVLVGEHDLTTSGETRHEVCGTTSHPDYSTDAPYSYDYAIVRLSEPVEIGPRAVPACLPLVDFGGSFLDDKTMTVSGWGTTSAGGSLSDVLMSVDVPGMSNAVCKTKYSASGITDAMLCAGLDEGGIDSCQGDSGGPLTYTTGTPARTYVVGVVSWGEGCAWAGKPGVYARVNHVLDWIHEQMAITC